MKLLDPDQRETLALLLYVVLICGMIYFLSVLDKLIEAL